MIRLKVYYLVENKVQGDGNCQVGTHFILKINGSAKSLLLEFYYLVLFAQVMSHLFMCFCSFVLCQINSIALLSTTNWWENELLIRLVGVLISVLLCTCTGVFLIHSYTCKHDLSYFMPCWFHQLKSQPQMYSSYVPMAYDDYLKKMSKFVTYLCFFLSFFFFLFLKKKFP